ncbi:uncharacterized protein LOC128641918 [Bombina bombina]|uniref:uncharacterized protein LOC128641918 n=1 Tax=Bombina bombina TaxID=8345 RepID=UPI00235B10F0|nr:uncharacterized protein LOC128641918 [Bombina bombina]
MKEIIEQTRNGTNIIEEKDLQHLDPKNVIVVITEVEDTDTVNQIESWKNQNFPCELLFFSKKEMDMLNPLHNIKMTPEETTAYKLNYMRDVIAKNQGREHVGIFSSPAEIDSNWLFKLLRSEHFNDWVEDVRHIHKLEINNDVTFVILYRTSGHFGFDLESLSQIPREKLILVIENLEDSGSEEWYRQLYLLNYQGKIIHFSKSEKDRNCEEYLKALYQAKDKKESLQKWIKTKGAQEEENEAQSKGDQPANTKANNTPTSSKKGAQEEENEAQSKGDQPANTKANNTPTSSKKGPDFTKFVPPFICNFFGSLGTEKGKTQDILPSPKNDSEPPNRIVIFSRSGSDNYTWLTELLESEDLKSCVQGVKRFYISNSNSWEFREEVGQCTFGILYHTKRRGRVNVTDVTDSLYDRELEYMSTYIKKENVIVVIDDLDDSSEDEKCRILSSQPSIEKYARDLILVTEKEKNVSKRNDLTDRVMALLDKCFEYGEYMSAHSNAPA